MFAVRLLDANRLQIAAKFARRTAGAVLERSGEIGGRGEAKAGADDVYAKFRFRQKFACLKYPAVLQQIYRRTAAGLSAAARQMGGRHPQFCRKQPNPHTRAKLLFHQGGKARDQPPRGIVLLAFFAQSQGLAFNPNLQKGNIGLSGPQIARLVAVQFALNCVEHGVQLWLHMHFANAQVHRYPGQILAGTVAEKYSHAINLRADLKAVHHAFWNEYAVVGRIATGLPCDGDAALTFGEP